VHDPLHLTLRQSRGHTGREHRHCDHRSDHPADRDETARQRRRRLFARAGLEKEEVNILRGIVARIDQLIARKNP